jgi:EmrB/QacA subfamily drug resistance transporter
VPAPGRNKGRKRSLAKLSRADRESAFIMAESGDGIVPASDGMHSDTPAVARAPSYRTTALIIACALFMQNLDATVLATALPTMARDFAVPPTGIGLALTSYLLALAIFIPASGTMADRYGARRVFQIAIALFVTGSIACGLSVDLTTLVIARFVQGAGGAMMVPVGRLVLLRTVAKRDLVSAMSWLAMPAMIGPILGPPVGGLIVTYLDWRWIFWINVPMGTLGIFLVQKFIEDVRSTDAPPLDRLGFVLSGLALGAILFGLQLASRPGHAGSALPLLAIGLVAALGYVAHAGRTARPILDLDLLRVPTFRLSMIGGTLIRITQGAQPFLLPMLMQLAFGLSAAASGAVTVATAIGAFAMKSIARPALRRFGFRTSLTVIGVLAPLSYAVTGFFRPGWPWLAISAVLFVCGFLVSLQFTAYNTIAYDEIEQPRLSAATSFYSTVQQLALSLGVCAASGILSLAMAVHGHAQPQFEDFSVAIWTVVAISLTALFFNLRFDPSAGAELSGHRTPPEG